MGSIVGLSHVFREANDLNLAGGAPTTCHKPSECLLLNSGVKQATIHLAAHSFPTEVPSRSFPENAYPNHAYPAPGGSNGLPQKSLPMGIPDGQPKPSFPKGPPPRVIKLPLF